MLETAGHLEESLGHWLVVMRSDGPHMQLVGSGGAQVEAADEHVARTPGHRQPRVRDLPSP